MNDNAANRGASSRAQTSERTEKTAGTPRTFFGIKLQLSLALIAMTAMTALVSAVAWLIFEQIERSVVQITQRSIPEITLATRIADIGADMTAYAPTITASRTQAERTRRRERLDDDATRLRELVGQWTQFDVAFSATGRLSEATDNIARQIEIADRAVEDQLNRQASIDQRSAVLDKTHTALLDALEPLIDDAVFEVVIEGEESGTAGSRQNLSELIDAGVTIDGVSTYTLSVVMPDGSIEDRTLTNGAGDHTTLTWTTALPAAPVPGAVWIVSPVAPRQFRILSVVEAEANIFEITALLHDPNKYARIEQGLVLDAPTFTALPSGALKKPINPSHSEYLYKPAATILTAVTFSWEAPDDARVTLFEVEVKPTDGRAFQPAGTTSSLSIDIAPTEDGPWEFRVRSLDNLGRVSPWTTYGATLGVLDGPPSDVQNFTISVVGSIATLSWDPAPDLNLSHYRIKRSPRTDGPGWGEAIDVQPRVEGTVVQIPANGGTFLCAQQESCRPVTIFLTSVSETTSGRS